MRTRLARTAWERPREFVWLCGWFVRRLVCIYALEGTGDIDERRMCAIFDEVTIDAIQMSTIPALLALKPNTFPMDTRLDYGCHERSR